MRMWSRVPSRSILEPLPITAASNLQYYVKFLVVTLHASAVYCISFISNGRIDYSVRSTIPATPTHVDTKKLSGDSIILL